MFLLRRQRGSLVGVVAVMLAAQGWSLQTAYPVQAAEPARPETKAAAAWKKLAGQVENPKTDRDRLREILLGFRRDHPGTSFALRAAELLADLPSPLDKLDPEKIPPLDRFEKQPKQLVAVLGEHRGRHGNTVTSVAYSPNGKWIASGGANSLIRIWDTTGDKLKEIITIQTGSSAVFALAFRADGQRLVTGSRDLLVRLWDLTLKEPKKLAELAGHGKDIMSVAFSPDGKTMASGGYDKIVILWDVTSDPPQKRAVLESHTAEVNSVAFSPDGRTLATAGYDGVVRLWSVVNSKPRERAALKSTSGVVYGIAFSPNSQLLAAGSQDSMVRLWDVASGKERSVLRGHADPVAAVAFGPDGRTLASGGYDWTVRLWDLAIGKPRERFPPKGHLSAPLSMACAPDGKALASAGIDRSVRLWTLAPAEPRGRAMIKGDSYVYTVAYSPDGKQLAAGYHLGIIRLLDSVSGRETGVLKDNPTYVTRVAFTPDGRRLLAASGKETLLWDVSRRKELLRCKTHETYINDLALSPDGRHAVTATGTYLLNNKGEIVVKDGRNQFTDCTLRLWDMASGELLQAAKGFSDPFQCVAFFPNSKQIASGSGGYDTATRFWSLQGETLNETRAFKGTYSPVQLLAVSPDARRLITMGPDGKLIEWDLATGKRLWEWAPQEYVHSLTFAADSRHLAVALGTGPVYVLRLAPPMK